MGNFFDGSFKLKEGDTLLIVDDPSTFGSSRKLKDTSLLKPPGKSCRAFFLFLYCYAILSYSDGPKDDASINCDLRFR